MIDITEQETVDMIIEAKYREVPEKQRRTTWKTFSLFVVACVLGGVLGLLLNPLLFQRATITLYPTSQTITRDITFTDAQLALRTLSPVQATQSTTVPTTGIVTRSAVPAIGTLTFYNAALLAQTISVGTLINNEVVTDATVTIPAGTLATKGIASVQAHTIATGTESNIPANTLYGPCCRDNILVQNSAFHGAANPTSFHTATSTDIQNAVPGLKTLLDTRVQKDIAAQIQPSETALPQHCTVTTKNSVEPGVQAESITVTSSERCTVNVYTTHALQSLSIAYLTTEAQKTYIGYQADNITTDVVSVQENTNHIKIRVQLNGHFSYRLTSKDEEAIKTMLSGKSKNEAYILLLGTQGINHIQVESQETLPDASRIDVLVATN